MTPGERLVLAKGGRGGKGNAHFTSSRMRSPRFCQPGEPGRERRIHLELQILADVGLMGAPNAGKTTLLKALTASKARVGAFPFTTLSPQLGVMGPEADREPLILAEIPGLITGAHLGKGLGHQFLRHLHAHPAPHPGHRLKRRGPGRPPGAACHAGRRNAQL